MARVERLREELAGPPAPDYWKQKAAQGWRLSAVEWVRDAEGPVGVYEPPEEIPYGLKIADDCEHLEVHPGEREALTLMLEFIVQDRSLTQVAAELNSRGFRRRRGGEWTATSVFNMLPRMIQVGPQIFSQSEWAVRRRRLMRVV